MAISLCKTSRSVFPLSLYGIRSVSSSSYKMTESESGVENASKKSTKFLNMENMNPSIKIMQYAVRGPIVTRAAEIQRELKQGIKKPFKEVVFFNVGDAHALGQKPLTYIRQILALVTNPDLIDKVDFNPDIKNKARSLLAACKGHSIGSYTDAFGIEMIRKHCVNFIQRRDDGIPADPTDILLCGGASEGIRSFLKLFESPFKPKPAILVPIPQYPLYSASLAEFNLHQLGYYLNEEKDWGLDVEELYRVIVENPEYQPRAIVIINPGNPTGQLLSRKNIEDIIRFSYEEKLFLLADEVYQENVYGGRNFVSFKKVLSEMKEPYSKMELASFHSASKGFTGECGLRGGYAELVNMDPGVKANLIKSTTARLCPTVLGQIAMDCVVDPPREGQESYELFVKEKTEILNSLEERAKIVQETFNTIPGIQCNPVQGALYAFPKITIPVKAADIANAKHMSPDVLYCFELLENTGMCVIPGSGFGQLPGSFHFRTTILPPKEKLAGMMSIFGNFHAEFLNKYS